MTPSRRLVFILDISGVLYRQIFCGESATDADVCARRGQNAVVLGKVWGQHKGGQATLSSGFKAVSTSATTTAAERENIFRRLPARERQARLYENFWQLKIVE